MHPPPPHRSARGGGVGGAEPPTKFSKRGGLTGSQFLKGSCWERGVTFFIGGCSFYMKNKLESEIFNNKKSLQAKCFRLL